MHRSVACSFLIFCAFLLSVPCGKGQDPSAASKPRKWEFEVAFVGPQP
jgi:hypothetical protein